MAERGEGFWGIAGAIRCENRVRAVNMAQRRWEKRPVTRISVRPKGEPSALVLSRDRTLVRSFRRQRTRPQPGAYEGGGLITHSRIEASCLAQTIFQLAALLGNQVARRRSDTRGQSIHNRVSLRKCARYQFGSFV